jgi:hypothetical protein
LLLGSKGIGSEHLSFFFSETEYWFVAQPGFGLVCMSSSLPSTSVLQVLGLQVCATSAGFYEQCWEFNPSPVHAKHSTTELRSQLCLLIFFFFFDITGV